MHISPRLILAATAVSSLGACATPGVETAGAAALTPPSIGSLDNLRRGPEPPSSPSDLSVGIYNPKAQPTGMTDLRATALKEAAESYGSQMGYAHQAWEIDGLLEQRSADLSQVFDFNRLVATAPIKAGVIVPPVVSHSLDAFRTNSDGTKASVADQYLTIVKPGRIAPVVPTWRDYLIMDVTKPDQPVNALKPENRDEQRKFRGWATEGWQAGIKLADAEFRDRMTRLNRDYAGMLEYRQLVAQGMMDRMVLADADFGVTGQKGVMRIGSKTVRIVSDAAFQTDPTKWKVRISGPKVDQILKTGKITPADALSN